MMTRKQLAAILLTMTFPAQPALACTLTGESARVLSASISNVRSAHWAAPPAFMPMAMIAVSSPVIGANTVVLEHQRSVVERLLIEAGATSDRAHAQTLQLTADDLAVLAANPNMVQRAGEMDELTKNLIWALVIAGVVVAIVIAADGSISIN